MNFAKIRNLETLPIVDYTITKIKVHFNLYNFDDSEGMKIKRLLFLCGVKKITMEDTYVRGTHYDFYVAYNGKKIKLEMIEKVFNVITKDRILGSYQKRNRYGKTGCWYFRKFE